MMRQIVIDPVTRLEGHLKVMVAVDAGKVVKAEVVGTMFRGFEKILAGRDPRDAVFLTQRICGVCPADLAARFVPAWEDGRMMYVAETAVTNAVSTIEGHAARLEDLDDKLTAKQRELRAEGLTDEQRANS